MLSRSLFPILARGRSPKLLEKDLNNFVKFEGEKKGAALSLCYMYVQIPIELMCVIKGLHFIGKQEYSYTVF